MRIREEEKKASIGTKCNGLGNYLIDFCIFNINKLFLTNNIIINIKRNTHHHTKCHVVKIWSQI